MLTVSLIHLRNVGFLGADLGQKVDMVVLPNVVQGLDCVHNNRGG